MLLKEGDKVHILIRRKFEKDIRRHLIGTVIGATDSVILVHGKKAVYNGPKANFSILPDYVSQIVSLIDSGNIVSLLPNEIDMDSLSYEAEPGRTMLTDGKGFKLRINETGIIS